MTTAKILLTTVLTTLTALAFAVVLGASLLPSGAIAHSVWAPGGDHGRKMGGHFSKRGGATLAERCERLSGQHTRMAGAVVSAYLDLDDSQESAMQPLLEVLDSWRADGQAMCFEAAASQEHSVGSAMAMLESLLARSATAVAELQPAYSAFEATLSDAQRTKIQDGIDRHHAHDRG
ncbi:MAG: hypothetical protein AB8B93_06550 [Pseudomonadales bacterium]